MPTETQKNFQKQMKELSKRDNTPEVYSYVHDDFVSNKVKIKRKRIIALSGAGSFLVIVLSIVLIYLRIFYNGAIQSLNPLTNLSTSSYSIQSNGTATRPYSSTISFINNMSNSDRKLYQIVTSINEQSQIINMRSFDSRKQFVDKVTPDIKVIQDLMNEMITWIFNDKVKQFRELSVKKYEEYLDGLKFYQLGVAKNNQENIDAARESFKQSDITEKIRRSEMIRIFKADHIRYEEHADGSITYWY